MHLIRRLWAQISVPGLYPQLRQGLADPAFSKKGLKMTRPPAADFVLRIMPPGTVTMQLCLYLSKFRVTMELKMKSASVGTQKLPAGDLQTSPWRSVI